MFYLFFNSLFIYFNLNFLISFFDFSFTFGTRKVVLKSQLHGFSLRTELSHLKVRLRVRKVKEIFLEFRQMLSGQNRSIDWLSDWSIDWSINRFYDLKQITNSKLIDAAIALSFAVIADKSRLLIILTIRLPNHRNNFCQLRLGVKSRFTPRHAINLPFVKVHAV